MVSLATLRSNETPEQGQFYTWSDKTYCRVVWYSRTRVSGPMRAMGVVLYGIADSIAVLDWTNGV
jgi:hypothetical protein